MTVRQQIVHKCRSLFDLITNLPAAYPKRMTLLIVTVCLGGPLLYGLYAVNRQKNLGLAGDELNAANNTYSAIHSAQDLMEFYGDSTVRVTAMSKAKIAVDNMQVHMHSVKGKKAILVFRFYLMAVEEMPLRDSECASLRISSTRVEQDYDNSAIGTEELLSKESQFFRCLDRRSNTLGTLIACQQQAFTLITGTNPRPVDTCIYRHDRDMEVAK